MPTPENTSPTEPQAPLDGSPPLAGLILGLARAIAQLITGRIGADLFPSEHANRVESA